MDTVLHFLAMGGYARYVWPAFAVAALALAAMLGQSLAAYRRSQRELDRLQQSRPARERR
jgi:heme exporter protein D